MRPWVCMMLRRGIQIVYDDRDSRMFEKGAESGVRVKNTLNGKSYLTGNWNEMFISHITKRKSIWIYTNIQLAHMFILPPHSLLLRTLCLWWIFGFFPHPIEFWWVDELNDELMNLFIYLFDYYNWTDYLIKYNLFFFSLANLRIDASASPITAIQLRFVFCCTPGNNINPIAFIRGNRIPLWNITLYLT